MTSTTFTNRHIGPNETEQAQMLKTLRRLLDATGLTMIFIAHDLAVVSCMCERAVVMDGGRIVEQGDPREVFSRPRSEAARALVQAVPDVGRAMAERFAGPQNATEVGVV